MKWALYCFSSRKDLEIASFGRIVKRGGVYQLWNDHDIIGLYSSRKKDLKVVSRGKERERERVTSFWKNWDMIGLVLFFSSRKKDLKISSLGRKREREKEREEIASFGRIVKI